MNHNIYASSEVVSISNSKNERIETIKRGLLLE